MDLIPLRQQPERTAEIAALLHSEWSHLPNWACLTQIDLRLQRRNCPSKSSFTLLACSANGPLMGTASVIEFELEDMPVRRYWLGEVFTAADFRGRGVGSALINACITAAQQQKIKELWLYTPDKQLLYQRLGWQEVEQREVNAERVSVMVRSLTHSAAID